MNSVRYCDQIHVLDQHYKGPGDMWPCVTFPLAPGILILSLTWWLMWKEKGTVEPSVQVLSFGVMLVETVFGFLCWVQCMVMLTQHYFVGGLDLCAFQGWYTGFYFLGQPLMVAVVSLSTARKKNDAPLPSPRLCKAMVGSILAIAVAYPLLPLFRVAHYTFPTAFCVVDMMDVHFGCPVLLGIVLSLGSQLWLVVTSRTPIAMTMLSISAVTWSFCTMLAVVGFFQGSHCDQNVFGVNAGLLYALLGAMAHLNQCTSPLIYGLWWRRSVSEQSIGRQILLDA